MTAAPLPGPLRHLLAAGGLMALGLLWLFDPLPIVDLPEHAAQVALLFQLGDPAFPFAGQYELNLFTPYLLAYLLAAFFALLLPVGLALKATLSAIALVLGVGPVAFPAPGGGRSLVVAARLAALLRPLLLLGLLELPAGGAAGAAAGGDRPTGTARRPPAAAAGGSPCSGWRRFSPTAWPASSAWRSPGR